MRLFLALIAGLPLTFSAPLEFSDIKLINHDDNSLEKYVVIFKSGTTVAINSFLQGKPFRDIVPRHQYQVGAFNGFAASLSYDQATALSNDPNIAYLERDGFLRTQNVQQKLEQKEDVNATWGLNRISHRTLRNSSYTYNYDSSAGEGTCAYVIDTGIYAAHPEFEGRATLVRNFDTTDKTDADVYGHGTHVAGTIASKSYGVAKKTKVFGMKVCNGTGWCELSNVIAGIILTISDSRTRPCPNGVVLNLSLGAPNSEWRTIDGAIKSATDSGIFVAVSAGNDFGDASTKSPASSPGACVAGASAEDDRMAFFSNYGPLISVFGPGYLVKSLWNDGPASTSVLSGTSMASPHLAGLAAYYLGITGRQDPITLCENMKVSSTKNVLEGLESLDGTENRLLFNGIESGEPS